MILEHNSKDELRKFLTTLIESSKYIISNLDKGQVTYKHSSGNIGVTKGTNTVDLGGGISAISTSAAKTMSISVELEVEINE